MRHFFLQIYYKFLENKTVDVCLDVSVEGADDHHVRMDGVKVHAHGAAAGPQDVLRIRGVLEGQRLHLYIVL